MIHLYTGDGKGKTTAAVGLAVRALGQGFNVVFAQFFKGCETGEISALKNLGAEIVRPKRNYGFWWTLTEKEKQSLRREHEQIIQTVIDLCLSGLPPDLLILDEFTYVYNGAMVSRAKCEALFAAIGQKTELVITGRAAADLADRAEYLTEMSAVKHPFVQGTPARRGIEF